MRSKITDFGPPSLLLHTCTLLTTPSPLRTYALNFKKERSPPPPPPLKKVFKILNTRSTFLVRHFSVLN